MAIDVETRCQYHALIGTHGPGERIVGGIAVDLQDAGEARQMPLNTFAAPTVVEVISEDRCRQWPIVARIGPQPSLLRPAG
jgi:hypothetical protein